MIIADQLDSFIKSIAGSVNKPEDHIRLTVCMILQVPIGVFMNRFVSKSTFARHIYSIFFGIILQLYMFREGVLHIYIIAFVSYLLMLYIPRNEQHYAVMAWSMGYLSVHHVYIIIYEYGGYNMDATTYTMLLVTKVWALAWAFRDGSQIPSKLNQD